MKRYKYRTFIILLFVGLAISTPAYAYLDPGTGNVMLQGLLGGVASGLAIIKIYWQRLKKFLVYLFSKKNKKVTIDEKTDLST